MGHINIQPNKSGLPNCLLSQGMVSINYFNAHGILLCPLVLTSHSQ